MATETIIGNCDECGRVAIVLRDFCEKCPACCTGFCESDYPADDPTRREDWEDD